MTTADLIPASLFPVRRPRLLYSSFHAWLLPLAALDVAMTCIVLRIGGEELNAVARAALAWGGVAGLVLLKAMGVLTVLSICEYVGRTRLELGRRVMGCAVAANTAAVMMAAVVLGIYASVLLGVS